MGNQASSLSPADHRCSEETWQVKTLKQFGGFFSKYFWQYNQQIILAMPSANIIGNAISKYFWQCTQQIFLAMPSADSATTIAYYGFSLVYAAGLLCKLCPSFQPHQLIQYLFELYKYLLDLYSYILDHCDYLVDLFEYLLTECLLE